MDNKDFEKNSIDDILKDFQAKRDSREKSDYVPVNVEPPKPRADFAKDEKLVQYIIKKYEFYNLSLIHI